MTDQMRRVGLLKAVGATPRLVAAVLLVEYVPLALLATALGLVVGRIAAPQLTRPSLGLLGGAGPVPLTVPDVATVTAAALLTTFVATVVPAVRAARTSTVAALSAASRKPRRLPRLIAVSSRLPSPSLLGLRLAARRPRRVVLSAAGAAVTVTGIVTALAAHAQLERHASTAGLADPKTDRLSHVLLVITTLLVVQAAVNAVFLTWATVVDSTPSAALVRALGAPPRQVVAGAAAAQALPATAGSILGIPLGLGLFVAVSADARTLPSVASLVITLAGTAAALVALTVVPARAVQRRNVAEILRSERT